MNWILVGGGLGSEKMISKDVPSATDAMGQEFYRVILQEEPFASTKVMNNWESNVGIENQQKKVDTFLTTSTSRINELIHDCGDG